MKYLLISFFIVCVSGANAFAFDAGPALTDRDIIESLTELKAGQAGMNKHIDDMGTRIDDMKGLLYCILAGIFALIGFVLWNRRTALAPAVKRHDALENALIHYSEKHPDLKEELKHAGIM